jgi:hypothetical protein
MKVVETVGLIVGVDFVRLVAVFVVLVEVVVVVVTNSRASTE